MASRTGRNRFRSSPGVVLLADPPVCRRERRGEKTTINSRQPLITTAFEAVWNRLITMRWYITAAITSTKTIKILSNIHSIEAAQCFSLNLNLQAPSPLAGLFVCPGRGRAGGYPAPAWTGPRPARVESVGRKYLRPKIPKVQGFAVTLLSEHRLLVFSGEITMAKVNLSEMSVETLMDLRKRVDQMLFERRAEIEKQLERKGRQLPWLAAEVRAH